MENLSEDVRAILDGLGSAEHIAAAEGDFIAADGMLHCGKCGARKEFRLPLNGRLVPVMCDCRREERAAEERHAQQRDLDERAAEMRAYSLIDAKFREARFANFTFRDENDRVLYRRLRSYVDNFETMSARATGLLLYGPFGTGKTFAAGCVANALMDKGVAVLVTSIIRLIGGGVFDDERPKMLHAIKAADLLVLDDFGVERDGGFAAEKVFDIIDSRINTKKPMIITTNIMDFASETNIRRKRVYDRLTETCIPLEINGESRRKQSMRGSYGELMAILDGGRK